MIDKTLSQFHYEKFFNYQFSDDAKKSKFGRMVRDGRLQLSDWTQVGDVPQTIKDAYAPYRQALRDLPAHANWPNITESDWPTEPDV